MAADFYATLGVNKKASQEEISKAYKKLAMKYHPDRQHGKSDAEKKSAEEKFKEISTAYDTIGDKDKRAQYDAQQSNPFVGQGFNSFDGGFNPFEDMMNGFSFGGMGMGGHRSQRREENLNLKVGITLTFEETYTGCTKTINYTTKDKCQKCGGDGFDHSSKATFCKECNGTGVKVVTQRSVFGVSKSQTVCPACQGKGKIYERTCQYCNTGYKHSTHQVTLNIPAGAYDGMELRVSGKGAVGSSGQTGDLYVVIRSTNASSDGMFIREDGFDLKTNLNLTYYELVSGEHLEKTIILPDKSTKTVVIPADCSPGTTLRIRGSGFRSMMQRNGQAQNGDLLIVLNLKKIGKLTPEQKELLKKFNDTIR